MKLQAAPYVHFVRDEVSGVITDFRQGEYFSLNELGCEIWSAVCAGKDDDVLAAEVAARFAVPQSEAQRDIESFIDRLRKEGWLTGAGTCG